MWNAHIGFFVTYIKGDLTHNAALKARPTSSSTGTAATSARSSPPPRTASCRRPRSHRSSSATYRPSKPRSTPSSPRARTPHEDRDGRRPHGRHRRGARRRHRSAKSLSGKADGAGSTLRAGLTGLLTQHVAQTGIVIETVVQTGSLTSPQTQGAIKALTENTNALGARSASLYGAAAKTEVPRPVERAHRLLRHLHQGRRGQGRVAEGTANKQLDGYRSSSATSSPGRRTTALTADQVAHELVGHVQTLEAAIDAIVSGKANAASQLAMAEMHMPGTAAALAKAIATAKAERHVEDRPPRASRTVRPRNRSRSSGGEHGYVTRSRGRRATP